MLDKLKQQKQRLLDPESGQLPNESPRSGSVVEDLTSNCPSLSYQERLIGCLTCFILGFVLSLGSTFRLARLVHGHPGSFAIAYTIGNILSLASSSFFVGPVKQVKTMFAEKRRGSTIAYLLLIVLTLTLCFAPNVPSRTGLVLLSVCCQFLALIWYTLSYIPFGRKIALSCCKKMCGLNSSDDE
jgi:hypothetical protein